MMGVSESSWWWTSRLYTSVLTNFLIPRVNRPPMDTFDLQDDYTLTAYILKWIKLLNEYIIMPIPITLAAFFLSIPYFCLKYLNSSSRFSNTSRLFFVIVAGRVIVGSFRWRPLPNSLEFEVALDTFFTIRSFFRKRSSNLSSRIPSVWGANPKPINPN